MKKEHLINWELLSNIHEDSEEMNKSEKFEKKVDKFGKKCEKVGWEWLKLAAVLGLLTIALFLLPIIWRL